MKSINGQKVDLKNPFQFDAEGGSSRELRIVVSTVTASLSGTTQSDAMVVAWPADAELWSPHAVSAVRAGMDGKFSFEGLAPGRYYADAWASDRRDFEDMVYDPEFLRPFESRARLVELGEGSTERADLMVTPAEATKEALDKLH